MKKLILILATIALSFSINAQSLERQVIGSAGLAIQNGSGGLSFTVGGLVTASGLTSNGTLTQGFQQAEEEEFVGVIDVEALNAEAFVFPNPTVDILKIESSLENVGILELSYQVLDLQGKMVLSGVTASNGGLVSVKDLAKSTYVLVLSSANGNYTQRVRFSKI